MRNNLFAYKRKFCCNTKITKFSPTFSLVFNQCAEITHTKQA